MTTSKELPDIAFLKIYDGMLLANRKPQSITHSGIIESKYYHEEQVQKLVEALEKISTTKFLSYEHSPAPPYGTGVTDGHRLAAEWAREALARFRGEVK